MAKSVPGGDNARPSNYSTASSVVPPELAAGAKAFQTLLGQIQRHVDQTPEDAEDFDYLGVIRLLLDTFRRRGPRGQLGFLMALGQYLTLAKGAGEPYDNFDLNSLSMWGCVEASAGGGAGARGDGMSAQRLPQAVGGRAASGASNVVRLFAEDRPPVVNPPRRRGRFPKGVVRLGSRPRLAIGDLCEMCRGALPENHGKRVRIVGFGDDGLIEIAAVSAPLATYSLETGERNGQNWRSRTRPDNLRRIREAVGIGREGRNHA